VPCTVPHVLCLSLTVPSQENILLMALLSNKQVGISPQLGPQGLSLSLCSRLAICGTAALCLRHVSFTVTQPPRSSPTTKEYFASQWRFLPSLVCAQNCLLAVVLTKALSSCLAELIQACNEFPVQQRWSPDTWGNCNEAEGRISLRRRGFRAPFLGGIILEKPPDC
jgi:hypothetical protein